MSDHSILVLNGPGLSDFDAFSDTELGITSLSDVEARCLTLADELDLPIDFRQSEDQDQIIDWIRNDANAFSSVIINQLGCIERTSIDYTRYCSDLQIVGSLNCRIIDLHMTNVLRHDAGAFRSLRGPDGKTALICGLGADSYDVALHAAAKRAVRPQDSKKSVNILILNGPNLNMLGTREPDIYGHETLDDIAGRCLALGHSDLDIDFRQSNYEGQLVDWIQQAVGTTDAIIINAAAYTHTSVALHDALKCYDGLSLELHISNPHTREAFRHHSFVSTAVDGVIMGFGTDGYEYALQYAANRLSQ